MTDYEITEDDVPHKRCCTDCDWTGLSSECMDYKHPIGAFLCPECQGSTEFDGELDSGGWNYRVYEEEIVIPVDPPEKEKYYSIHETYYDANGKIWACSKDPDPVCGESIEGIRQSLTWMLEALDKPVLRMSDIPEPSARSKDLSEQ